MHWLLLIPDEIEGVNSIGVLLEPAMIFDNAFGQSIAITEPEERGPRQSCHICIGKVKVEPAGPEAMQRKETCPVETGALCQSKVAAERGFQGVNGQSAVPSAVLPIVRTAFPRAIGRKAIESDRDVFDGLRDNLRGQLRQRICHSGMRPFCTRLSCKAPCSDSESASCSQSRPMAKAVHSECADGESAIADEVPVVRDAHPPLGFLQRFEARESGLDSSGGILGQRRVPAWRALNTRNA